MRVHLTQLVDRLGDVPRLRGSQREPAQNTRSVVYIVLLLHDRLAHGFAELVVVHHKKVVVGLASSWIS